ncbi:hypothetical protein IAU59_003052 [Kwoniella sp. CBS 9459]
MSSKSSSSTARPRPVSANSSASAAQGQGQSRSDSSSKSDVKQPPRAIASLTPAAPPSFVRASSSTLPAISVTKTATATAVPPSLQRSRSTIHLPLYRRILFPTDAPSKPVPPLVVKKKGSGNANGNGAGEGDNELDLINERLYHLIALALRAYVLSWYTRFTTSRTLPSQINQQIIHPILSPVLSDLTTEEGQERLWVFLLVDLPTILALHVRVYWEARAAGRYLPRSGDGGDVSAGRGSDSGRLGQMYHARLPLLSVTQCSSSSWASNSADLTQANNINSNGPNALADGEGSSSEYALSPLYLSTLSSAVFSHYVGPNRPDVERLMAREVLSRSVLGSISRRLVEGWFWHMIILKLLGEPGTGTGTGTGTVPNPIEEGLDAADDNLQSQQAGDDLLPKGREVTPSRRSIDQSIIHYVLKAWSIALLAYSALINLITIYSEAPVPSKTDIKTRIARANPYARCWEPSLLFLRELLGIDGRAGLGKRGWIVRMSWAGLEMIVGLLGPILDRLLPHLIRTYLLTPGIALKLIDIVEHLLFPLDGWPGPSPVDPTAEEAVDLRMRAEERIGEVIPTFIQTIFFPKSPFSAKRQSGPNLPSTASSSSSYDRPNPTRISPTENCASVNADVDDSGVALLLSPLENRSCNAHLVAMLLDNVVATLMPELALPSTSVSASSAGIDDDDNADDDSDGRSAQDGGESDAQAA